MRRVSCAVVVCGALLWSAGAKADDYVWAGPAGGDWNDANNWDPQGVPGTADTATVEGDVVNAQGTIRGLTATGARFTDCYLRISPSPTDGPSSFQVGGGLGVYGTLIIEAGVPGTVQGDIILGVSVIENHGDLAWLSGGLFGGDGSIVRNYGTLTVSPAVIFGYDSGSNNADIYNLGTLTYTGPGTISTEGSFWALHNSGTLIILSGAIELHSPGNSTHSIENGSNISGSGTLRFFEPMYIQDTASPTSSVVVSGQSVISTGATVELAHGAQLSGYGTLQGPGTLRWSAGAISPGPDAAAMVWDDALTVQLTGSETKYLGTGRVESKGNVTWDAGDFAGADGAVLANYSWFTAQGDLAMVYGPGGDTNAVFENHGTFARTSGSGLLKVDTWAMDQGGTLDVQSGVLQLGESGNAPHALHDGALVKGAVRVQSDGGPARLVLDGAPILATGTTLELASGGRLEGAGSLTGSGTVLFDGGAVTTAYDQSITFGGEGYVTFAAGPQTNELTANGVGQLVLAGTTTWSGGALDVADGTLVNQGMFVARTAGELTRNSSAVTFDNRGTFVADPGTGTVRMDLTFLNSGSVAASSGLLHFAALDTTFQQVDGALSLVGGDVAAFVPASDPADPPTPLTFDLQGGRLEGAGTVDGLVQSSAVIAPGSADQAGTLTFARDLTQTAAGSFEVKLGGTTPGAFDVLAVHGDVALAGDLKVALIGGFTPAVGDSFEIVRADGTPGLAGAFAPLEWPTDYAGTATYTTADAVLGITEVPSARDGGAPDQRTSPDGTGSSGGCTVGGTGGGGLLALAVLLGLAALRRRAGRR